MNLSFDITLTVGDHEIDGCLFVNATITRDMLDSGPEVTGEFDFADFIPDDTKWGGITSREFERAGERWIKANTRELWRAVREEVRRAA